jgi:hypothetical protein
VVFILLPSFVVSTSIAYIYDKVQHLLKMFVTNW